MLKALLFGFALIGAAVLAIAATALLAVLFLFANASQVPHQVYLLESVVEEKDKIVDVAVEAEKIGIEPVTEVETELSNPVFLLEVVETNEKDVDLNSLTIPKLKELAKGKGIYIKSNLRKPQIIELLSA